MRTLGSSRWSCTHCVSTRTSLAYSAMQPHLREIPMALMSSGIRDISTSRRPALALGLWKLPIPGTEDQRKGMHTPPPPLVDPYEPPADAYDEAFGSDGYPRDHYRAVIEALSG